MYCTYFCIKNSSDASMEFRTRVELPKGEYPISHSSQLMLWGSCFAENIGKYLSENKFTCDTNPFGVLYNPLSISKAIGLLMEKDTYSDLRFDNNKWYSLMHHSVFSASEKEECLRRINHRFKAGKENMQKVDWLILTWGTAWVYEWKETGEIVGNCHKLPDKLFRRRLLSVAEVVENYRELLAKIHLQSPQIQVLFTVSPIRHAKDGYHGNQISKSILLLAIEQICAELPYCHYFPSYEIMMDELRDYRFYADDMLHPSALAVNYIWECFCQCFFSKETLALMKEWDGIKKGLEHKPFNPESDTYYRFLSQILLKIEAVKEKFPYLDVQNELSLCQMRLKK